MEIGAPPIFFLEKALPDGSLKSDHPTVCLFNQQTDIDGIPGGQGQGRGEDILLAEGCFFLISDGLYWKPAHAFLICDGLYYWKPATCSGFNAVTLKKYTGPF